MHFPGAEVNTAFRTLATLVYDLILETPNLQPVPPEGYVRGHLRAAMRATSRLRAAPLHNRRPM